MIILKNYANKIIIKMSNNSSKLQKKKKKHSSNLHAPISSILSYKKYVEFHDIKNICHTKENKLAE